MTKPSARAKPAAGRKVTTVWGAFNGTTPFCIGAQRSICRKELETIVGNKQRVAEGLREGWLTIEKVTIIRKARKTS